MNIEPAAPYLGAPTPTHWEGVLASALSHLADDEVSVLDLAADLERDRDSYRLLASVLLEQLHTANATIKRQSATIGRLHDLVRDYVTVPSTGRERRAA